MPFNRGSTRKPMIEQEAFTRDTERLKKLRASLKPSDWIAYLNELSFGHLPKDKPCAKT